MSIKSYGVAHSSNINMGNMIGYYGQRIGPSFCNVCQTQGTFEGVFYGLCDMCCSDDPDRIKLFKFIQEIQACVNTARQDYPTDEWDIVKDTIESGFYLLNIRTKAFYEKKDAENSTTFCLCRECNSMVDVKTVDHRRYCLECQNPEYDPVWSRGD